MRETMLMGCGELQQPEPNDYVLATGETHSVREFAEKAFQQIGIRIMWEGVGVEENLMPDLATSWLRSIDVISVRRRSTFSLAIHRKPDRDLGGSIQSRSTSS